MSAVMLAAIREASDPDLWWHLATGRYIWTQRSIPAVDVFSFTAAGHRWVTHEWLSDVLLYAGYRLLGHAGLSLLFAALIAAAFGLVFLRCRARPVVSVLSVVVAALASMATWGVRPQILSLFFTSLYLYILEREPADRRAVWLLAPLTMLWANLHSGFLTGIAIIGVFAAGEELHWLQERHGQGPVIGREAGLLALVAIVSLACGVVTPNAVSGVAFPFGTLGNSLIQDKIREWSSPDFHEVWAWPLMIYWLALLGALMLSRRRVTATQWVLLLGTAAAALYSARHVPYLSLVGAPVLAGHAGGLGAGDAGSAPRRMPGSVKAGLGLVVAVLLVVVAMRAAGVCREGSGLVESLYPAAALDYLEQHGLTGRIYNAYHWGGYLIWRGQPVFIDGRTEAYGDDVFGDYLTVHEVRPGWEKPLLSYEVETVLVQTGSRLAVVMKESRHWQVAYEDDMATVFRRAPSGSEGS